MTVIETIKVIIFGIVEGYTEWLPISSTGHLILLENIMPLGQSEAFWNVFKVVIQLGAILAVMVLFWDRLWPFSPKKSPKQRSESWELWFKVIIACLPAAIVGIPLDDFLDEHMSTPTVIGITLILYGVIFILLEHYNKGRRFRVKKVRSISYRTALLIGIFQCLSLIPGTSRSGATILGAMILGCSRAAAAEFSFFLGVPVMFGASLVKIIKHGLSFSGTEIFTLLFGMLAAFITAALAIRFLMNYIRKHDFSVFGVYRIALGFVVLIWFAGTGH